VARLRPLRMSWMSPAPLRTSIETAYQTATPITFRQSANNLSNKLKQTKINLTCRCATPMPLSLQLAWLQQQTTLVFTGRSARHKMRKINIQGCSHLLLSSHSRQHLYLSFIQSVYKTFKSTPTYIEWLNVFSPLNTVTSTYGQILV
jgi:hypothetical protein